MATLKKKTEVTSARSVSAAARPVAKRTEPSYEEISQRARQIWESSGCQPGHDLENWLRAESELRNGRPA